MTNTAAPDTHAGKWDAAMRQLLAELDEGRRSGEEEGWVDGATVRAHFRQRAMTEAEEDDALLAVALSRLSTGSGVTHTLDEVLRELGITQEELDGMDDVELE